MMIDPLLDPGRSLHSPHDEATRRGPGWSRARAAPRREWLAGLVAAVALIASGCGADETACDPADPGCSPAPIDPGEIPQIVDAHYLDLDRIVRISRFRSGVGHSY